MSRITPVDPYKLIKILRKIGFAPIRQKGSHVILSDDRGRRTVIPCVSWKEGEARLFLLINAYYGIWLFSRITKLL